MTGKCPVCGAPLEKGSCGYCGYVEAKKPEPVNNVTNVQHPTVQPQITIQNQHFINAGFTPGVSRKSKMTALLLCIFFGYFGAHHFYVGRRGTGLLFLVTFGLAGLGWIVDIFRIATGSFTDEFDLPLV